MRDELRAVGCGWDHTRTLEPLEVQLLLDGRQRNETREEVARRHYWIAAMTQREGLPVDWEFVALRMAQALLGLPEGDEA